MNTHRGWFLIIGLMAVLLLGGGAYFFLPSRQSAILAPSSPSVAAQPPVAKASSPAPSAAPAPLPQSQAISGPALTYRYNTQGQVQAIIYPDGAIYTYRYNASGDKISETNVAGKTWSYVYDQNHHPIAVIDPEGHITHKEASASAPKAE